MVIFYFGPGGLPTGGGELVLLNFRCAVPSVLEIDPEPPAFNCGGFCGLLAGGGPIEAEGLMTDDLLDPGVGSSDS